jgi:hypothetical protein
MICVGDMVRWRDQTNYPGLCGIVTEWRSDSYEGARTHVPREIFVHWTSFSFPKDYPVGSGWERVRDLELLSTGETK